MAACPDAFGGRRESRPNSTLVGLSTRRVKRPRLFLRGWAPPTFSSTPSPPLLIIMQGREFFSWGWNVREFWPGLFVHEPKQSVKFCHFGAQADLLLRQLPIIFG